MGGNEIYGLSKQIFNRIGDSCDCSIKYFPGFAAENKSAFADENQFGVYKDFILKAVELGLIKGANKNGNTYFYPNQQLTREHAVLILGRYLGDVDTQEFKQLKMSISFQKDHELREKCPKG